MGELMADSKKKAPASKKRKSKKNQKKSVWWTILVILIAVFIFLYRTNPAFQTKVDTAVETAVAYVDSILNPGSPGSAVPPENIQTEKTEPSPVPTVSADGKIVLSEELAIPLCAAHSHGEDHEIRNYDHYSVCYREAYEQAEWSAYCLDDSELVKNAKRGDDFRPDPEISTGTATLADYKGSGYDRGHLAPAADFAFDQKAMSDTFYMSNMSPQAGGFNRGIWKDLESQVRVWGEKFGRIYVISGPVLDEPASAYDTIGKNQVSVPKYYYKVLLIPLYADDDDKSSKDDVQSVSAIGFILPNEKCNDSYFNYVKTVDEVEQATGLDFFSILEDGVEAAVEAQYDLSLWQ